MSPLPTSPVEQRCLNWCWAACAQMVLEAHGIDGDQCEIARQALGLPDCCPDGAQGGCNEMISISPAPDGRDIVGVYRSHGLSAEIFGDVMLPHHIAQEIAAERPIEVYFTRGIGRGHVVLVVGVQPSDDPGDPWLIVFDPDPNATHHGRVRFLHLCDGMGAGTWAATIHRIGA